MAKTLEFDVKEHNWLADLRKIKKSAPDAYSSEVYDWIDETLEKAGLKIEGKHPGKASQIGKQVESQLYSSLWRKINDYLSKLSPDTPQHEAVHQLHDIVNEWVEEVSKQVDDAVESLYLKGWVAGLIDSGVVKPSMDLVDKMAMEFIKNNPYRIGSRIRVFADDIVEKFRQIIINSYTPEGEFALNELVKQMKEVVPAERYKLERIARTETAAVSNMGRINGWDLDEDKYYYEYHWNAVRDNRAKPISIWRMENNPWTFDDIVFLWTHQEQFIGGKWWPDQYNQRCSVSRSL